MRNEGLDDASKPLRERESLTLSMNVQVAYSRERSHSLLESTKKVGGR